MESTHANIISHLYANNNGSRLLTLRNENHRGLKVSREMKNACYNRIEMEVFERKD